MSVMHHLPPWAAASSRSGITPRTPVRTDHKQYLTHLEHLEHSHFVLITRSWEKVPSQGTFFHFPFSLIRMTLLAMYTGVYIWPIIILLLFLILVPLDQEHTNNQNRFERRHREYSLLRIPGIRPDYPIQHHRNQIVSMCHPLLSKWIVTSSFQSS